MNFKLKKVMETQGVLLKKISFSGLLSVIFFSALVVSSPSLAAPKVNFFISSELSHSSNLETPIDAASQRDAFGLTFNAQYQNLDYSGGYIVDVGITNQTGSLDKDKQNNLMLSLSFLSSLNDTWLIRNNISFSQFENSILPSNSNTQIAFNNTIGSLAVDNSGVDYSFNIQKQTHNDLPSDSYLVLIPSLQVEYYFPHHKKQAYWSLSGILSAHNYSQQSNVNRNDYRSFSLKAAYVNGHILGFDSSLSLIWQQDTYNNPASGNASAFQARRHRPQQNNNLTQVDQLMSVETRFLKPLNKSSNLVLKVLWGTFLSNSNNTDTNFYKVSSAMHWVF